MSITLYFGLPGSGKTTFLAKIATKAIKEGHNVTTNVYMSIDGLNYCNADEIGQYEIKPGLLLLDEGQLNFHNREYRKFTKEKLMFFSMHRHYNIDVILFSQGWDSLDKRIRELTTSVYYVTKTFPLGFWLSKATEIPYSIIIPKDGEHAGEIIQGYNQPTLIDRFLNTQYCWRPNYYKLFNSWEVPKLPQRPKPYYPPGYPNEKLNDTVEKENKENDINDNFKKENTFS